MIVASKWLTWVLSLVGGVIAMWFVREHPPRVESNLSSGPIPCSLGRSPPAVPFVLADMGNRWVQSCSQYSANAVLKRPALSIRLPLALGYCAPRPSPRQACLRPSPIPGPRPSPEGIMASRIEDKENMCPHMDLRSFAMWGTSETPPPGQVPGSQHQLVSSGAPHTQLCGSKR